MMKNITSTIITIAFAASFAAQNVIAAEPLAGEILKKSQLSMEAEMQYHVSTRRDSATTVIYQKALTNGTIVSRCEESSGRNKVIYLYSGDITYELLPDANVALELGFGKQTGQMPSINPYAKVAHDTVVLQGLTEHEGQMCYKIQARLVPMDTNLIATLQGKDKLLIPDACQYLIETNTYHVLQMTILNGKSTYASAEFKNFGALPELPQDFFIVPPSYKIERPSSLEESKKLKMKYIALKHGPKNIPKGFALDPETHLIVKVDPKSGANIPLKKRNTAATSDSPKSIRAIVLSILVISSIGFFAAILRSQYRRKKTS